MYLSKVTANPDRGEIPNSRQRRLIKHELLNLRDTKCARKAKKCKFAMSGIINLLRLLL